MFATLDFSNDLNMIHRLVLIVLLDLHMMYGSVSVIELYSFLSKFITVEASGMKRLLSFFGYQLLFKHTCIFLFMWKSIMVERCEWISFSFL